MVLAAAAAVANGQDLLGCPPGLFGGGCNACRWAWPSSPAACRRSPACAADVGAGAASAAAAAPCRAPLPNPPLLLLPSPPTHPASNDYACAALLDMEGAWCFNTTFYQSETEKKSYACDTDVSCFSLLGGGCSCSRAMRGRPAPWAAAGLASGGGAKGANRAPARRRAAGANRGAGALPRAAPLRCPPRAAPHAASRAPRPVPCAPVCPPLQGTDWQDSITDVWVDCVTQVQKCDFHFALRCAGPPGGRPKAPRGRSRAPQPPRPGRRGLRCACRDALGCTEPSGAVP